MDAASLEPPPPPTAAGSGSDHVPRRRSSRLAPYMSRLVVRGCDAAESGGTGAFP